MTNRWESIEAQRFLGDTLPRRRLRTAYDREGEILTEIRQVEIAVEALAFALARGEPVDDKLAQLKAEEQSLRSALVWGDRPSFTWFIVAYLATLTAGKALYDLFQPLIQATWGVSEHSRTIVNPIASRAWGLVEAIACTPWWGIMLISVPFFILAWRKQHLLPELHAREATGAAILAMVVCLCALVGVACELLSNVCEVYM